MLPFKTSSPLQSFGSGHDVALDLPVRVIEAAPERLRSASVMLLADPSGGSVAGAGSAGRGHEIAFMPLPLCLWRNGESGTGEKSSSRTASPDTRPTILRKFEDMPINPWSQPGRGSLELCLPSIQRRFTDTRLADCGHRSGVSHASAIDAVHGRFRRIQSACPSHPSGDPFRPNRSIRPRSG
jgi:hypothetical protein